jgi:hypothetical protein
MNKSPSSPIRIVPLDHANDGANPCRPRAALSNPIALLAGLNDRAEPAQPPARHPTARSLPPRCRRMFARTSGDRPASAAGPLQSP